MALTMRAVRDDDDIWRIRDFLRQVFLLNGRQEASWHVARYDYWRWQGVENSEHFRLEEVVFVWETADGEIAAVLNPEGQGEAFLQVHPGRRTPELEEEMVGIAEEHLAAPGPNGRPALRVWASDHDELRRGMLARRGYAPDDGPENLRRRLLSLALPDAPAPPGYTVRALGDVEELPARSWVSWKAFHPDEPDERYQGWEWYHNIQRCPLYRRDLDIVAIAPGGEFASFCTVWYDDVTRSAYFEPVGAAPAHQRRGLGRAVMSAALRRLERLGATVAFVGAYSPAANALYASVGFAQYGLLEPWVKEI